MAPAEDIGIEPDRLRGISLSRRAWPPVATWSPKQRTQSLAGTERISSQESTSDYNKMTRHAYAWAAYRGSDRDRQFEFLIRAELFGSRGCYSMMPSDPVGNLP